MAKLYLVRRNLEVFTGPMTLVEMKDAYKRMQFGLQDEVAGHCGPWVTFENLERIKKQYPEVARIVHDDMIAGWNISSDNEGKQLINEDTKRIAIKSVRGMSLALVFLFIAVVAFIAALYMANSAKTAIKAKEQLEGALRPEDLQNLLDKSDSAGFDRYIQKHSGELVAQINQSQAEETWLPYLRRYAFEHDGQMTGLDPKYLRGDAANAAPVDCSLRIWRRRWRTSSKDWNDLLGGRELVRAHWARLIAWDPYWIKRREHKGWLGSDNYYAACLTMADKALTEVGAELAKGLPRDEWNRLGYHKIKARLAWLQASLGGTALAATEAAKISAGDTSSLGLWTCFETAADVAALNKCRRGMAASEGATWQSYNEERYGWNLLRLASAKSGSLPLDMVGLLIEQGEKMNKEDHFTRFDYRPEARLFVSMMHAGMPIEQAIERAQTEFPSIKLTLTH